MSFDEETLIPSSPEDRSLKFKKPIKIFYYALRSCDFEHDEETGYTMPNESFDIKHMYIHSNEEMIRLYEKVMNDEIALPIPMELQFMFGMVELCGGYKPKATPKSHE